MVRRDPRIHWLHALNPRLVDNAMAVIDHADAGGLRPIGCAGGRYATSSGRPVRHGRVLWRPVPRGDRATESPRFSVGVSACAPAGDQKTHGVRVAHDVGEHLAEGVDVTSICGVFRLLV